VLRVVLTGGIGSGKSTVSNLFAARQVPVADADQAAHALTAPGEPALGEIHDAFGPGVLRPDGHLDRARLRAIVFERPEARRRLEAILHPRIRARLLASIEAGDAPYGILAIPLYFETGRSYPADRVLVVDLPEETQIRRVQARSGLDEEEIRRILASQATRAERLAGADDLIDNSGPPEALAPQVERLHALYLQLAGG
jgi:dephospho-CoA kinase